MKKFKIELFNEVTGKEEIIYFNTYKQALDRLTTIIYDEGINTGIKNIKIIISIQEHVKSKKYNIAYWNILYKAVIMNNCV